MGPAQKRSNFESLEFRIRKKNFRAKSVFRKKIFGCHNFDQQHFDQKYFCVQKIPCIKLLAKHTVLMRVAMLQFFVKILKKYG